MSLMGVSGLEHRRCARCSARLGRRLGIAINDMALTAFVHSGVVRSSRKRFDEAAELETVSDRADARGCTGYGQGGYVATLHLRVAAQTLRDAGVADPLPERLRRILRSIAYDGRGDGGDAGSIGVQQRDVGDDAGDVAARVAGFGGTRVAPT